MVQVVNNVASLESNDDDAIIAPSNDEDDAGSHIKDGAAEAIPESCLMYQWDLA